MAIALRKLIEDRSRLAELGASEQRCFFCGVLLQETITGKRQTPEGDACSDCYYEKLGEGVEQHPVASGGVRRG